MMPQLFIILNKGAGLVTQCPYSTSYLSGLCAWCPFLSHGLQFLHDLHTFSIQLQFWPLFKWQLISWWLFDLRFYPSRFEYSCSFNVLCASIYFTWTLDWNVLVLREADFAGSVLSRFFREAHFMGVRCIGSLPCLPLLCPSVSCPLIYRDHFPSPLQWLFDIRWSLPLVSFFQPSSIDEAFSYYSHATILLLLRERGLYCSSSDLHRPTTLLLNLMLGLCFTVTRNVEYQPRSFKAWWYKQKSFEVASWSKDKSEKIAFHPFKLVPAFSRCVIFWCAIMTHQHCRRPSLVANILFWWI